MLRFNPSIGLTSVPTYSGALATGAFTLFQSLNRAYKRSDGELVCRGQCHFEVSIPQSGLQAFRPILTIGKVAYNDRVSIPQSGLQAFRHRNPFCAPYSPLSFQSLNRAYKRSDPDHPRAKLVSAGVSIPQSGLQAFRLLVVIFAVLSISLFQSLNRAYKRSDHPGLKRRQA